VKIANIAVDKGRFDAILGTLIASPPIRQVDLKPKRKRTKKRGKKPGAQ